MTEYEKSAMQKLKNILLETIWYITYNVSKKPCQWKITSTVVPSCSQHITSLDFTF